MFHGAPDVELGTFVDGRLAADAQFHNLFIGALLDKVLVRRLDFGQLRVGQPVGDQVDDAAGVLFALAQDAPLGVGLFRRAPAAGVGVGVVVERAAGAARARHARVARLGLGRPRRRVALARRLGQHLAEREHLLARDFAHLEAGVAR